ncbi:uncharacterized protein N7496_012207 [Penicillium cataractarum]|uniref:Uncharacterized protein n=1 Tax=Penicillium cataractarum TaxID=2100454 RepID=A0A9W9R798_9EURO|nr:uncharacterized protein N7496_012207 [Penicillium cataractarum]KAJ5354995.1 hypothetical protein N7496_012207 [Penicillium cataractarum]
MKATHSSSGLSASGHFTPVPFEPPKTSLAGTKIDGSYELFQSMAGMELNWPSKTPSFGSVTESSPSLSSSFDFMDVPREEPIPCGLPLPESTFMGHLPDKDFAPGTHDAPFIADSLSGSNDTNSSFQYPMGTETKPWTPQYYPDRLAWPALTTLPSCSWPMPENSGISSPETQLIPPYHFTSNNILPSHNHDANIPSAPRPDEPDYSSITPLGMSISQSPPTTILQTHTGLPPMPDCTTSFPIPGLSTPHPEPPQLESENPAIKASLHYSDARNALLIEWKRAGLSYKDIKRMGGFKEAESTLRGRFRTLTKAKEHRVRKPKWLKSDVSITPDTCPEACHGIQIQLLCEAVAAGAGPASPSGSGYTFLAQANFTMAMTGQPPKVSWKKVAQYIWSHGGSYQFGNATCKKKWCDIHGIKI